MPNYTTNYHLAKPLVNDPIDEDLWGGELNNNMDIIDTAIKNASGSTRATSSTPDTISTTDANNTVLVDASGGAFTVNLLAAATAMAGFTITIKKVDTSANTVTIDGNGSETIDGALTYVIGGIYQDVTLISDGTNWRIKQRYIGNVYERIGADIASTSTIDLRQTAITGRKVNITGTTAITAITLEIGQTRLVRFSGILTLTYNATSLIVPGSANITTAAGDYCEVLGTAAGVEVYNYIRASGQAVVPSVISKSYVSTEQALPSGGSNLSLTHALGTVPTLARAVLRCKVSENGWNPGDEINVTGDRADNWNYQVTANSTNVIVTIGGNGYSIYDTSGAQAFINSGNWRFIIYAYA